MQVERLSSSRRVTAALISGVAGLGWAWGVLQVAPNMAGMLKTSEDIMVFFGVTLIGAMGVAYILLGRVQLGSQWGADVDGDYTPPPTKPAGHSDLDGDTEGAMPAVPADEDLY